MSKHVMPKTGKPIRVSNEEAEKLVKAGGKYLSKSEFRRLVHADAGAQK